MALTPQRILDVDRRSPGTQVGFRETRVIPLTPTASAAVAYK
jgi:hypothetical protein